MISLGLEALPRRIEGYDISNIGPEIKVGSKLLSSMESLQRKIIEFIKLRQFWDRMT